MSKVTFTLENFEQWLKSRPLESSIGHAQRCRSCPIAVFLRESIGKQVTVGFLQYRYGKVSNDMPHWARAFMVGLDSTYCAGDFISARLGLRILDSIKMVVQHVRVHHSE